MFPIKILAELRQLAAFHCKSFDNNIWPNQLARRRIIYIPPIDLLHRALPVDEESDSGTEDDADANDLSGFSGSSGGGARMRSERAARDAAALVTLPIPDVIVEVVP
jgi:hypothetical protein